MSPPDKELEEQLSEAGNKLLQPPPSLDELLLLLDQVESSLSKVEQSPVKSMHDALSTLRKALVANDLLRHPDLDVKVAVASCISDITRITAPDAPYDDDIMKDVFQLIVSSFENLNDQSSRSYNKRVFILETVAKVRSCVVMLDLECERVITEMFQHFLKAIREDHPENVFSSMATIMTLVLEESEEVSLELLTPLLASVKMDNEEVTPIAKRLGETVFANCAAKLKPYLAQAVESLQISLNEYNKIVTSVLEGTLPAVDDINDSDPKDRLVTESKLAELPEAAQATQVGGSKVAIASSDKAGQPEVFNETTSLPFLIRMAESSREEACSDDIDPAVNRSPKSITSNGVSLENVGSAVEAESLMIADLHDTSKITSESDDSKVEKSTKSEPMSEQTAKKSGRNTNTSINSAESSHQADSEKEAEKLQDHQNDRNKDDKSLASEDPAVELSNSLEKEAETTLQHSAPKESEGEAVNVAPSSLGQSIPDESALKKDDPLKDDSLNQEESVSKKESEATSDLEVKLVKCPLKITPLEPCRNEKGGSTNDTEAKKQKQSGKKNGTKNKSQVGPYVRNKDGKQRGHGKASVETVPSQESPDHSAKHDEDNEEEIPRTTAKRKRCSGKGRSRQVVQEKVTIPESPDDSAKHENDEEELPMTSAKRKRSSGKDRVTETADANLVGKKIRVWWPLDEALSVHLTLYYAAEHVLPVHHVFPFLITDLIVWNQCHFEFTVSEFYEGIVDKFDSAKKKFTVNYTDGDVEKINLGKELWELVGDDNMSEEVTETADANLVGKKIRVWWPLDEAFYEGIVDKFDSPKKKFTVNYTDGDVEKINLGKELWELVGDDNMSEEVTETADANLVGKKIRVWWPLDEAFYEGIVDKFDSAKKKFTVNYTDGDVEKINLEKELWELVGDDNMSEEEQVASADAASERHKKKKPRNTEPSAKHERMEASPRSKLKDTTTKSGQKSKGKLNLKDGTSKSGGRTDDTTSSKPDTKSKKSSGKSVDTEKPSTRSKDVSSSRTTPKSKSKQETVKAAMKSKNKSANGMEKLKSSSSKVKESGNQKEKATNSAKYPDSTKEKFSSASKEHENEPKSRKKRGGRGKN